ncbi:MAG: SRPBCC family protein [Kineosporiaceae bacterium]
MPTDNACQAVEVEARLDEVLATIRDVAAQPEWIPEILEAEVLETSDDGLPLTARFAASSAVGTDRYTLAYEHRSDGMSWTMVKGRLETGQEGSYTLVRRGPTRTHVTYDLTIHHNLPLPHFIRARVIEGLVSDTLTGLKERMAG